MGGFHFGVLVALCCLYQGLGGLEVDQTANLIVDTSETTGRKASDTLFGIFFEEINHAGAGGLWAELVNNRGFEAGGQNTPSNIDPWGIIGDESTIHISTDRTSCFERNKVALLAEVLCDATGSIVCPAAGVGIYNPGFWGMNIEQGKSYKVVLHVKSLDAVNISVALTSANGSQYLASTNIIGTASDVSNWTKMEVQLIAKGTDHNSRLQLTTTKKGVIWFDQISAMPVDTYRNKDVTGAVQKVAAAYDCKIVEGVLSHQLKQFVIDGNKVILSVTSPNTKVDDAKFEVYAVDIVASTGDGKPKLLDEKQTTIYKRAVDKSYHLKMKASRFIFSDISQNFPIMPFTARALDEKRARLGLVECVNHELLQPYPVLHEKPGLSFYTSEKEAAGTALKEMNGKIINWWMIMVDVAKTNPPKYSRGSPRPRY